MNNFILDSFTKVQLEISAPLAIFNEPTIKELAEQLFNSLEPAIKKRIFELLNFIDLKSELDYNSINSLFRIYFYKFVLSKSLEMALAEEQYNIKDNILSLLSKENLEPALYGVPMHDAFKKSISNLHTNDVLTASLLSNKLILLEEKFTADGEI